MYEQDQHELKTIREGERTVYVIPNLGWVNFITDIAQIAQPGDKIVVGSLAQEKHARASVAYYNKPDVTVERGAGLVRFDADAKNVDPKQLARQIMEHLTGIRARHQGETNPDPENNQEDSAGRNDADRNDNQPDQPEQGRTD